jgi:hypothetical protein
MTITVNAETFLIVADRKDVTKLLREIGKDVTNIARNEIMSSTGGKKRGAHTASLPGQAPANLTGKLAASFKTSVRKNSVKVTDTAYYAVMLEGGAKNVGRNSGTIEPRPFLSSALSEIEPGLQGRFDEALDSYIQKVKT